MEDARAAERAEFVESTGLYFERLGLSRTSGRVLGHLFVEESGSADAAELCAVLDVAKSTLSVSLRRLEQLGLVRRHRPPGRKRDHYRVTEDVFGHALQAKVSELAELGDVLGRGLRAAGGSPSAVRRLQTMIDMNEFLQREFSRLLEEWDARGGRGPVG